MSDRSQDLSDFQLTGGSIKLIERPSTSSHSSLLKRYNLSRFSSRPSSAIPRLCSGDNMMDDFTPTKNDRRPYSADFVIPTLLSTKSKETLTDGSFESIYIPLDCRLPSANLYKELLEEDVDKWRPSDVKTLKDVNSKEEINKSHNSIPILVVTEPSEEGMSDKNESYSTDKVSINHSTRSERKEIKNRPEAIEQAFCSNFLGADLSYSINGNRIRLENEDENSSVKDGPSGNKYNLTPGLTTKPPLPKKKINSHVAEPDKHNNAIYDFFAIKYDVEYRNSISLAGNAEKPMCEEISREAETAEQNNHNQLVNDYELHCNENGNTLQLIKTVETFDARKKDEKLIQELSLNNWLQEVNLSENVSEINAQAKKNTKIENERNNDFPLLSDLDLDELFRLDDDKKLESENEMLNKRQSFSSQSSLESARRNSRSLRDKDYESIKTTITKFTAKKTQSTKTPLDKFSVNNKINKEKKTFNKSKFIATPIKLPKTNDSPRHIENTIVDNVETWISCDVKQSKRQRQDFTDLINTVEDLKSTTEVITSDVPNNCTTPILDDEKQLDFDEIETIIEALEYQDQTSQNNIKSMKKIITHELSNSMILNENEKNLNFKKKEDLTGDIISSALESTSPVNDSDSGLVSPTDLYADTLQTDNAETHQEKENYPCGNNKNYSEKQEAPQRNRELSHSCGSPAKSPGCFLHNYRELLSYLDEVDKKGTETLEVARERAQTASQLVLEWTNSFDTMPKVEDLLSHTPEELASYVIDITLRLKDKTSCIGLLQNELSSLREKLLTQTKQSEISLRQKLKEQKEETERITKRHQKFIDQLMEEKKTFARRCEELVDEMTAMKEKYVSNMKAVEHKHQVEMQKMKDMHAASEKLRRERWIEGRTQKIKEMAVKSIEPEVERMEKRHQEELSNLRSVHKREIEELELRAARKLQEHSETLREHLVQDREKALAHERDVMRLRYEKMVESEERNYQEQRRRLLADHANRVADCEERETQAAADKERSIKQAQEEFEEKLQVAARRHANEIKLVKETAVIELENWKNSFRKQQSTSLMEKETSIRKECRKERDREIEIVIERLENEANVAKTQLEQTTENRIKRLKQKYEAEIRDLEMLEKDSQNKYSEARSKLIEYEDAILNLRTTIKQLETQLTEEKLKRSKLESEREEIRKEIRKEFEDKLQSLEREVEQLRTSADKQVEQLYSRVRVSLARKDDLLEELTNDHKALKEKCIYLENIIEQQRKEFMINS